VWAADDGRHEHRNVLLDEIERAPNGDFEIILSADEHPGNGCRRRRRPSLSSGTSTTGTTRRADAVDRAAFGAAAGAAPETVDPQAQWRASARRGDFAAELAASSSSARPEHEHVSPVVRQYREGGAAAAIKPVMGSFQLAPDEALVVEVEPPRGLYWSYSLGNP
jgi:hypothetical protein